MSNNVNSGISKKRVVAYLSSVAAIVAVICEIINGGL